MKYLFEFKEYLNDNFWHWFGNSKVVDSEGNPLIVYHGTNSNFSEFKQSISIGTHGETDQIEGIYFTDNKDGANWFAFIEDDPNFLKSVYLSMKKPFYSENYNQLKKELNIDKLKDVRTELIKMGYDGLIIQKGFYSGGGPFKLYLVFEPTQIKSATNNNGLFDLKNPNINEIQNKNKNDMKHLKTFENFNPYKSEYYKGRYEKELNIVRNAHIGDIFENEVVYIYVEFLVTHGSQMQDYEDSFGEGDLGERLEKFPRYKFMEIPLDEIDLREFTLDTEVANEYAEKYKKTGYYPPLVVEPKDSIENTYRIIDGNQRGNGLKIAGEKSVLAFVGMKN